MKSDIQSLDMKARSLFSKDTEKPDIERVKEFNSLRKAEPFWEPTLCYIDLRGLSLQGINLERADLGMANLEDTHIRAVNFEGAIVGINFAENKT